MTDSSHKNPSNNRRERNSELIRRMRNGEQLNAIDSRASWFPPRPIIKKDEQEMSRLYNGVERRATPRDTVENRRVVRLTNVNAEASAPSTASSEGQGTKDPVGEAG